MCTFPGFPSDHKSAIPVRPPQFPKLTCFQQGCRKRFQKWETEWTQLPSVYIDFSTTVILPSTKCNPHTYTHTTEFTSNNLRSVCRRAAGDEFMFNCFKTKMLCYHQIIKFIQDVSENCTELAYTCNAVIKDSSQYFMLLLHSFVCVQPSA